MPYQRLIIGCMAAALCLSAPTPAFAESAWDAAESRSALKWEMSYLALSAIDTGQTIQCLQQGLCEEANPLFGKHPSPGKLIAAKIAFGAAHFALFNHLHSRDPHAAMRFAQGSVLMQGGVVLLNARFTFK